MTTVFHPGAKAELFAAADYYDRCADGLGGEFIAEVEQTLVRIEGYPIAWPILGAEIRRCLVARFPYGLIYRVDGESIEILAVMHLHRQPGYWLDRSSET